MSLRCLFIDFNAYFASVEQQERPELRSRPVAVIPVPAETTCCIAVSYEAKRLGVPRGMRVAVARRACPGLRVVEARPELYVEYHHRLKEIIDSCVPLEEVLSIDEMTGSLTGKWAQRENALLLAEQLKRAIAEKIGPWVRCSIGLGPNKLIAKAACGMQKPDGLVAIERHELPGAICGLELRDLNGVGPRMLLRLQRAGLHTVEQLCAAPRGWLRKIWGSVEGERMHDALRGEWFPPVATEKGTVGHSHVLSPRQRHEEGAHAVLHRLLEKASLRLRKIGCLARRMQLFVEYVGEGGFSDETTFCETSETLELIHILNALWQRRPRLPAAPLMVGVTLVDLLDERNHTPSLFAPPRRCGHRKLGAALDQINARFGKSAIYFGGSHTARDSAPTRIAFHFVPEKARAHGAVTTIGSGHIESEI